MDNFSNQPLAEKKSVWPYVIIIILVALLAIAGTVIYYEKKITKEKSTEEVQKITEQTATKKEPAEEAVTNTGEQTPGQGASGTTTPADNTADNPTSSDINITLPDIKPIGAAEAISLPMCGINAPQPV